MEKDDFQELMEFCTVEEPDILSKERLLIVCRCQKQFIHELLEKTENNKEIILLGKSELMKIYGCEADKALRILKVMFQMGLATKIGKTYQTTREKHEKFVELMLGKEVQI
mgnify:CR=1 FL=1|jgi:hypothetical protein